MLGHRCCQRFKYNRAAMNGLDERYKLRLPKRRPTKRALLSFYVSRSRSRACNWSMHFDGRPLYCPMVVFLLPNAPSGLVPRAVNVGQMSCDGRTAAAAAHELGMFWDLTRLQQNGQRYLVRAAPGTPCQVPWNDAHPTLLLALGPYRSRTNWMDAYGRYGAHHPT